MPPLSAPFLVGYFATLWVVGLLCLALAVAVALTWFRWRRGGRTFSDSALLGAVVFFALAVVVATLLRDGWPRTVQLDGWNDWSSQGWDRITYDPSAREILANGVLFLPVAFVPRAADARQSDLHAVLEASLGGTTVDQYEEWEQDGQLTDQVFRVAEVYIDGHAFPPGGYTGRWPATFLWESRCVFVDWTPQGGAEVRDGSGEECRRFMS